ncbi:hypothetical protein ACM66B_001697 [Microbotryomycetes sp. NB124-2]
MAGDCKVSSSGHGKFDLTGLRGKDYKVKGPQGQDISVSFCGPVSTTVWAVDHPETVGAYYEGTHGGVSLGQVSTEPTVSSDGILSLKYLEGSRCPNSNARRASVIQLQCDQSSWSAGTTVGQLKLVNNVDDCTYFFTIETPHACAVSLTASVLGSLSVFIMFVLIAALVSFGSTIAYNRLVLGKRGSEQIPSLNKVRQNFGSVQAVLTVIGIALLDVGQMVSDQIRSWTSSARSSSSGRRWQPTSVDYASWWANNNDGNENNVASAILPSRATAAAAAESTDGQRNNHGSKDVEEAFRIGDEMIDAEESATAAENPDSGTPLVQVESQDHSEAVV